MCRCVGRLTRVIDWEKSNNHARLLISLEEKVAGPKTGATATSCTGNQVEKDQEEKPKQKDREGKATRNSIYSKTFRGWIGFSQKSDLVGVKVREIKGNTPANCSEKQNIA